MDENGWLHRLGVFRNGKASKVPAVAPRQEWQHPDCCVFSGVQRARKVGGVDLRDRKRSPVQRVPGGYGGEDSLWEPQFLVGDELHVRQAQQVVVGNAC